MEPHIRYSFKNMRKTEINIIDLLDYYKHHSINECAKIFKVSTKRIIKIIEENNCKRKFVQNKYLKEVENIKTLYLSSLTPFEIAEKLRLKKEKVSRILKTIGISYKKDLQQIKINKKISDNNKKEEFKRVRDSEIISSYNNGNSLLKTSHKFKTSISTIKDILKSNNIEIINRSRIKCNVNYFENIDSSDKAYFLGWMISDGWINKKGIGIALNIKDKNILENFKKCIKYEGNIGQYTTKKGSTMVYLIITSEKLKQDLSKYGVIQAKTNRTYFPEIPEKFYSHFIRGVFDGDGCISANNKNFHYNLTINIIGNILLIEKIQEILMRECILNKTKLKIHNKCNENIVYLVYGGNRQCKRIYDYLYKDCNDLFLKRKKEKFETLWNQ